jgi:hypothetical protein
MFVANQLLTAMTNKRLLRITAWAVSFVFYSGLLACFVLLPVAALTNRLNYSLPVEGIVGDLPNKLIGSVWVRAQISQARLMVYDWASFQKLVSQPVGLAVAAISLLRGLVWLLIVWWLKQLLDQMLRQDAFHPTIARQLRRIGLALLTLPLLTFAGQFAGFEIMRQYTDQLGAAYSFHNTANLPLDGFLTAGLVLLLAQIFKYGTNLQHEQDLTI